jgi:hypothetical protein
MKENHAGFGVVPTGGFGGLAEGRRRGGLVQAVACDVWTLCSFLKRSTAEDSEVGASAAKTLRAERLFRGEDG